MNKLNSYDRMDTLNTKILENCNPIATIEGTEILQFDSRGGDQIALSSQAYPYTTVGAISIVKSNDQINDQVVNQYQNRYGANIGSTHLASQLILLDSTDEELIKQAIRRDARHTGPKNINKAASAAVVFGLNDQPLAEKIQWFMENKEEALAGFDAMTRRVSPQPEFLRRFSEIVSQNSANYDLMRNVKSWLYGSFGASQPGWERFVHHDLYSARRVRRHFKNLDNAGQAEARGEYAAAKYLLTIQGQNYQMKIGKAASGRTNGIDQIWIRRNMLSGAVEEYLIIESKGSLGAKLTNTEYGQQMSPKWVFFCLVGLFSDDHRLASSAASDRYAKRGLVEKILDAMINNTIPVTGYIFQAMTGLKIGAESLSIMKLGRYNLINAYQKAKST
ncbi:hypothetical protein EGM97_20090 [Pseudomonas sp. AF32]|uniref:hypothetical protein n=1 Tax=Pseudomonas sp. AF32 TaxID=554390 RepID=UPI001EEEABEC|nr:hypothetical protein [Pseudomonas sp. AF32]MCG6577002.1 hypothetical protein [Pseudomonas sp. AF32]